MSGTKVLRNLSDFPAAYYDSYEDYYDTITETLSDVNASKDKVAQLCNRNNVSTK